MGTRAGEGFISLLLPELQSLFGGHTSVFSWASGDVDMRDPLTGCGPLGACCTLGEQGPTEVGALCVPLSVPLLPSYIILPKMLEFQGLETSMHHAKAKHPQVQRS